MSIRDAVSVPGLPETTARLRPVLPHLLLVVVTLLVSLPIIFAAIFSTQSTLAVYEPTNVWPGSEAVTNYATVLIENDFLLFMRNSLAMTVVVVAGQLVFSLFAATALVYYDFRFQNLIFYLILLTLLMPLPVRIVPLYQLMADLGWLNTFAGLVSPFIASAAGIFLFRQKFRSIPESVVETAKLDNVGPLTFLVRVLIPMSKGMIAGVVAIMFITTWNAYLWPLTVLTERSNQVVQVGLSFIQGTAAEGLVAWNLVMAAGILALLPPLLVLVVARRYLLDTLGGS